MHPSGWVGGGGGGWLGLPFGPPMVSAEGQPKSLNPLGAEAKLWLWKRRRGGRGAREWGPGAGNPPPPTVYVRPNTSPGGGGGGSGTWGLMYLSPTLLTMGCTAAVGCRCCMLTWTQQRHKAAEQQKSEQKSSPVALPLPFAVT